MQKLIVQQYGVYVLEKGKVLFEGTLSQKRTLKQLEQEARKKFPKAQDESTQEKEYQALRKAVDRQAILAASLEQVSQAIRNSVTKDILAIQVSKTLEENRKVMDSLTKRLSDWYAHTLPELRKEVDDHQEFVKLVLSHSRKELLKRAKVTDEESVGTPLSKRDMEPMKALAASIVSLIKQQEEHIAYLEELLQECAPNLLAVGGAVISAKLLEITGDLKRLSQMPASTIQTLGAETALFKHMAGHASSPKYGVILNHPLVQRARKDQQGKAARMLANKIAIAAKVDYFGGEEYLGYSLREELEKEFK